MTIAYILFIIGLIFIIKGGDLFVDSATWIAKVTGLPEVIIGATIVSLATTLPETSVSAISVLHNETGMALGNALGSIICNTGLVLGLSNLIKPSKVFSRVFYVKGLMLLSYIIIFWFLAAQGIIDTRVSFILLAMLLGYLIFNLNLVHYKNKQYNMSNMANQQKRSSFTSKEALSQILLFIFGAAIVLIGSNLLVDYGVVIATHWGVPTAIISLTLISLGTSLPELITTLSALRKGHTELSLGNILGANILNLTMVLGISSQFNPLPITVQNFTLDIPVAFGLNFLLIIPAFFAKRISRPQAFIIFLVYVSYISYLYRVGGR